MKTTCGNFEKIVLTKCVVIAGISALQLAIEVAFSCLFDCALVSCWMSYGKCETLLKPLGFDWIRSSAKIGEILNHPNSRVQKAIKDSFPTGPRPFIWAFNLQLPSKENYDIVSYFASTEPITKGSLIDQFLKGDDHFRNSRLKMIADIIKGPWIVKKAVGEQAICVVGRMLSCKYVVGDNFFEVDIDIGSNIVAKAMFHLVFGYFTAMTADVAFLIEGQTKCELPERVLGCFRFSDLNPASAMPMEASISLESDATSLQSSMATGLWKSVRPVKHDIAPYSHVMGRRPKDSQSRLGFGIWNLNMRLLGLSSWSLMSWAMGPYAGPGLYSYGGILNGPCLRP
ncbi:Protein ENHANCED DISEASE RESISTANCE 2-like protein, partial [Cucurbita argyrosperma subsp. sororia]